MKKLLALSILLVLLFATGCGRGAAVQNINNSGFIDSKVSMSQVEHAIKKGASKKGWMVKRIKSGLLEARNNIRGRHLVVVEIPYNTKGYKINYKDSQNLKYNAEKGTIHPNYNKWIANLERNINYQLSMMGVSGNKSTAYSAPVRQIAPKKATPAPTTSKKYAKASGSVNTQNQTIYIKQVIPYSANNRVAENIKTECSIDQQLAQFIRDFSLESGLKVEYKNNPSKNDLFLDVQIDDAISRGGAWRGHNKFTAISGTLTKGGKSYGSFKAGRISGGGFWGAYKGSCSVLGRTVKTLGKDVAGWLYSPMDNARLGDTQVIRY